MSHIRKFYKKTHHLWTFSRLFLMIVFIGVIYQRSTNLNSTFNIIAVTGMTVYVVMSIWILVTELFKKLRSPKWIMYFSAVFLTVTSIVLIVMLFDVAYPEHGLSILPILLVPIWIFLLGVKDLFIVQAKKTYR